VILKAAREAQLDDLIHTSQDAKNFVIQRWRQATGKGGA
jgi:hypothetical protein